MILKRYVHSHVQFNRSVMSDSLRPHEPQHARPPCPSPTLGVYPNSCPLSRWCHLTTSSSVSPFSSHPQSFPGSGSFQMSQLFTSGGQSIGVSASTSALPKNIQDWSPLERTGWISLLSKGLSRVFSNTTVQKHQFFGTQLSSQSNSHPYMTTGKTIALTTRTFVGKVMSLLFNVPQIMHNKTDPKQHPVRSGVPSQTEAHTTTHPIKWAWCLDPSSLTWTASTFQKPPNTSWSLCAKYRSIGQEVLHAMLVSQASSCRNGLGAGGHCGKTPKDWQRSDVHLRRTSLEPHTN